MSEATTVIGAGAIAVLAIFSMLNSFSASQRYSDKYKDPYQVQATGARFAAAAARLPPGSTVGYFTDVRLDDDAGRAVFFAAQYALAPRLLVDAASGTGYEYAVRDSHSPVDLVHAGAGMGLTLVADLGNGVALYRKGTR